MVDVHHSGVEEGTDTPVVADIVRKRVIVVWGPGGEGRQQLRAMNGERDIAKRGRNHQTAQGEIHKGHLVPLKEHQHHRGVGPLADDWPGEREIRGLER